MNAEEFIDAVYLVVYESAVKGTMKQLAHPSGRRPRPDLVELSAWFNELSEADKKRVGDVARLAADHAVFGVLAVLDGVRVIDDGGRTELYIRTGDGTLLNDPPELHDLFRWKVDNESGFTDEQG